jgi:hypothetical protein
MTNEKRKKKVISVAIHNLVIKKHKAKMKGDFAKIVFYALSALNALYKSYKLYALYI